MGHEDARWFKSSYSGGSGTECVEVAGLGTSVGVRDSKQPAGPYIALCGRAWADFVASLHPADDSCRS
ncbi:DUF397 domain-containing protein [Streptomyces sp. RKAG290]|uniref:DUF397 domain-containing protein n=1 Tax=Streptomyces sp. RKAG290 TaxID=2888348 RepID=UPI002033AF40|nr:DUF397 domain-containing protein [Streptomyces sp. RKAG290]MCM2413903.1 DUF397 domain-containing protein [Streptomyces sp. RKAG290]